jgi:hypothetical protein
MTINGEFTCSIVIARCTSIRAGGVMRWNLRLDTILAQTRLTFIINALRRPVADEAFLTMLRAEAMHTLPRPLAEQLESSEA